MPAGINFLPVFYFVIRPGRTRTTKAGHPNIFMVIRPGRTRTTKAGHPNSSIIIRQLRTPCYELRVASYEPQLDISALFMVKV